MSYDIESIKRRLLVKYPFFGSVIANVDYKEDNSISTLGTDGKTIYYNTKYLEGLNKEQQLFVYAHEVCHIAFNHILRGDGKDAKTWNIAADAVINQLLMNDGLQLAPNVVDMSEAINYSVEQLYEKLMQQKQKSEQQYNDNSDLQESNNSNENVGHDDHSMWADVVKKSKEKSKSSENSELDEEDVNQSEIKKIDEQVAFEKNYEERKRQIEELKDAIAKQIAQAGKSTNSDIRMINDIGNSKPIIDWRRILISSVRYDIDWSYKNASIEYGVICANLEKQPTPEIEIVLDTSGSINEVLLKNFLRECKNVLKFARLKVGCFDTKFYGFQEIKTENDIDSIRLEGGGGTDFNVAVNAFSRRVYSKIIFTDGEASMPDMAINAIWIVFGSNKIEPKGGRVINITQEQLDRLCSDRVNKKTR